MHKYIFNEKGFGQILTFLVLISPIVMILSLITVLGEYWFRDSALDNANKQFVASICKKGSANIDITIDSYIDDLNSILGSDNYNIKMQGKINNKDFEETNLNFLIGKDLGRNNSRQDTIGVYVESKEPALISNVVKVPLGWFTYKKGDPDIRYISIYKGEIEPWLDE
ncbi:hypothetical protein CIW83_02910 [Tissierella sp. P1]|uniref:hypothetical protein n=1 Tax=Tissierella sp. P1 TaxID=1280483 RepID=UPI000BA01D2F|nr:hypothetical protein [Tissierella sp. P1]OZV13513.1 hypothetical protein CIW83_02910 [Tissierella sp. P1]